MQIGSAFSRRRLLLSSGAALLGGTAAAAGIGLTPSGAEGPFYPYGDLKPPDHDWDLVNYAGHSNTVGEVIYIEGRVLSAGGRPIANAAVEIWQANAEGNYNHPDDYRADEFQGFGGGNDPNRWPIPVPHNYAWRLWHRFVPPNTPYPLQSSVKGT